MSEKQNHAGAFREEEEIGHVFFWTGPPLVLDNDDKQKEHEDLTVPVIEVTRAVFVQVVDVLAHGLDAASYREHRHGEDVEDRVRVDILADRVENYVVGERLLVLLFNL